MSSENRSRSPSELTVQGSLEPIRRHATWLLVIFLIALSFFATRSLIERVNQLSNASLDRKWMGTSGTIGLLIHELQRERGLSSGFVASRSKYFGAELEAQQRRTDSSLQALNLNLHEQAINHEIYQFLDSAVIKLPEFRLRVRQLVFSV